MKLDQFCSFISAVNDEKANKKWSNDPDGTPNATHQWGTAAINEEQDFLKFLCFSVIAIVN